jgi:hypothetical protein
MRFQIVKPTGQTAGSRLVYREKDYAFDIEPTVGGFTSVLVNDISLEVDESGRVVSVWGYCPYVSWITSELNPPVADAGDVIVQPKEPLHKGASVPVIENRRMPVLADPVSRWVYISSGRPPVLSIQVFRDVILQFDRS